MAMQPYLPRANHLELQGSGPPRASGPNHLVKTLRVFEAYTFAVDLFASVFIGSHFGTGSCGAFWEADDQHGHTAVSDRFDYRRHCRDSDSARHYPRGNVEALADGLAELRVSAWPLYLYR